MRINTHPAKLVVLALVIGLGVGCGHEEAEQAPADLAPIEVTTVPVAAVTDAKPIEVYGIIQPAQRSFVSSRVTGPVSAIHVDAGTTVARGSAMLDIQPQAIEGQVAQTRGALGQAQAALALAERNYSRYEALHAEGASSDVELDMARMQLEQARGAVTHAEGAVQTATSVADEAVVRAPFAARVVDTLIEIGDLAAPGRPLVEVESLEGRQIWLTVRAADIERVAPGQSLDVRLDTRADLGTLEGTVAEIVPSADPATHTFTVKISLGDAQVSSGLAGRAWLPGDSVERLLVPVSAVHHRGGLELVIVRSPDGTARTRAVTTGAETSDGRVEILSGLSADEPVVVDAPAPVADGTPLEVRS